MTQEFQGKRLLFIAPKFFGYERDMQNAFEGLGLEVDFIDERPDNSGITKAIVRVAPQIMQRRIRRYYQDQQRKIAGRRYDYVFLLKGEVVPDFFLTAVQSTSPTAQRIFYTYDSISNSPSAQRHVKTFDQCWTIDYDDASRYENLQVLPLFYAPDFRPPQNSRRPFDTSFVGTVHSGRYKAISALMAGMNDIYKFFYCPATWYFFVSKYILKTEFKDVAYRDVSFNTMSREEVAATFRSSVTVADIQRKGQSGLTMRTFEVLASGSSLITTNREVMRLGSEINAKVLVLDDFSTKKSRLEVELFIERVRSDISAPDSMSEYSVERWAQKLLAVHVSGNSH